MNLESVLRLFEKLSGLSEEEGRAYSFLCELAVQKISAMVGSHKADGGQQVLAAAALAYYRYVLLSVSDNSGAVKIGEVSLGKDNERVCYAERVYKEALAELGVGALDEFVFEGI